MRREGAHLCLSSLVGERGSRWRGAITHESLSTVRGHVRHVLLLVQILLLLLLLPVLLIVVLLPVLEELLAAGRLEDL
jgi:hypothetical protein